MPKDGAFGVRPRRSSLEFEATNLGKLLVRKPFTARSFQYDFKSLGVVMLPLIVPKGPFVNVTL